jgi:hypothetical protein
MLICLGLFDCEPRHLPCWPLLLRRLESTLDADDQRKHAAVVAEDCSAAQLRDESSHSSSRSTWCVPSIERHPGAVNLRSIRGRKPILVMGAADSSGPEGFEGSNHSSGIALIPALMLANIVCCTGQVFGTSEVRLR